MRHTHLIAHFKRQDGFAWQVCQYRVHLLLGQAHIHLGKIEPKDEANACVLCVQSGGSWMWAGEGLAGVYSVSFPC